MKKIMLLLFRCILTSTSLAMIIPALMSCSPSYKQVNWHFVLPEDYQGFLAVEYNCSGGSPLQRIDETIVVVFEPDGTYCTSDSSFAWEGNIQVETSTGRSVPIQHIWSATGYGFYVDGLMTIHSPRKRQFSIYWAGDIEHLASIRNQQEYSERLDQFLAERFGVPSPQ